MKTSYKFYRVKDMVKCCAVQIGITEIKGSYKVKWAEVFVLCTGAFSLEFLLQRPNLAVKSFEIRSYSVNVQTLTNTENIACSSKLICLANERTIYKN